jgi:hypothetical protein
VKLLKAQNHYSPNDTQLMPLKRKAIHVVARLIKLGFLENKCLHSTKKIISQFTEKLSIITQNWIHPSAENHLMGSPFVNNLAVRLMNRKNSGYKLKINSQQGLLIYTPINKSLKTPSNCKEDQIDMRLNISGLDFA